MYKKFLRFVFDVFSHYCFSNATSIMRQHYDYLAQPNPMSYSGAIDEFRLKVYLFWMVLGNEFKNISFLAGRKDSTV